MIRILLASKLSGTCQSALVAKDIVEYERIYIIDSMQATLGTQLLTERAFALQKEGKKCGADRGNIGKGKRKGVYLPYCRYSSLPCRRAEGFLPQAWLWEAP